MVAQGQSSALTVTMNQGYNLRNRSIVDPLETPDPIQRVPAPSPMVRVPLAEPDQDMSADLNVPAADGPSVPTSTSDGPPARHTRPVRYCVCDGDRPRA